MNKVDKYIHIIRTKCPDLIIDKIDYNEEGQNNDVVIINDDLIFRFPKYEKGIEALKIETGLLLILKERISLTIPVPQFYFLDTNECSNAFSAYKLIKGSPLRRNIFNNIQDKLKVANQLAIFLKELHNVPLSKINDAGISVMDGFEEWLHLYNEVREKLFPFMREEARSSVSKGFENFLQDEKNKAYEKVLIHGDFGPSNILYNNDTQIVTGIIDFSEASIGDPAIDFASLIGPFGYGEDFLFLFKEIYPQVESFLGRARFYASTFALQEVLFGLKVNDEEAFRSGIKQYA